MEDAEPPNQSPTELSSAQEGVGVGAHCRTEPEVGLPHTGMSIPSMEPLEQQTSRAASCLPFLSRR